ncbi:MAG: hypothetical protein JNM13_04905 [Hyphomicrobiaceae bacterium]|nr:hypothetical protein [Hyphomicrobiaceae bacterium]
MDLAALRIKLRRHAEKLLCNDIRTRRFIQNMLVIGGLVLAGGSEALSNWDSLAAWKGHLVTLWPVGLLLSAAGSIFLYWIDRSDPEILLEAEKAIVEAENRAAIIGRLEEDFFWFSRVYSLSNFLREIVEQVELQGSGDGEEQAKRFGFMLDLLVADKGVLFGMNDDRWNFAIYLFNRASGELDCVACRRPIRAEEEATHRSWKPGIGHVGIAYQTARTIVAADTSEPEARALFDAPEGLRNSDDVERYRSIASVPIRLQDESPIGVVVGTSDVPERFHLKRPNDDAARDPVEPIRSLAIHLAMLIHLIHK